MLSVKPTTADEQSISRVFNGVTLTGTYTLQDGIVMLRTAFGNKTAQLLGSDADTLASIMLRELYQDYGPSEEKSNDMVILLPVSCSLHRVVFPTLQIPRSNH